jgi:hypothetical protein
MKNKETRGNILNGCENWKIKTKEKRNSKSNIRFINRREYFLPNHITVEILPDDLSFTKCEIS